MATILPDRIHKSQQEQPDAEQYKLMGAESDKSRQAGRRKSLTNRSPEAAEGTIDAVLNGCGWRQQIYKP